MRKKLPVDVKRSSFIGIKVRPELKLKLAYIAGSEDMSLSSLVEKILVDYLVKEA